MKKKILIGSIIAVAIILLSSFSSVVGKVSTDNELVEFDVEFCGLGKKQTVHLTQQEAIEVEQLFDDIEQQLSEVETRGEAEIILKDAIVELDKYGFLGDISIEQSQRLVCGTYKQSRLVEQFGKYINNNNLVDDDSNYLCLVVGETTNTYFQGPIGRASLYLFSLYMIILLIAVEIAEQADNQLIYSLYRILLSGGALVLLPFLLIYFGSFMIPFPFNFCSLVGIGDSSWAQYSWDSTPGEGYITTYGLNGKKEFYGEMLGSLPIPFGVPILWDIHAGILGFTGISINLKGKDYWKFYFGSALVVKINDNI